MRVVLELSDEEAQTLQAIAQAVSADIPAVLHGLIAQFSAASAPASADTPIGPQENADALAEHRREQEEVEVNINRWHAEQAQR